MKVEIFLVKKNNNNYKIKVVFLEADGVCRLRVQYLQDSGGKDVFLAFF